MKFLIDGSALLFSDVITGVQRLEIEITEDCIDLWADNNANGYVAIPANNNKWLLFGAHKMANIKRLPLFFLRAFTRITSFRSLTNLVYGCLPSKQIKQIMTKYYSRKTRHLILLPGLFWSVLVLACAIPYVLLFLAPKYWKPEKDDAIVVLYSNWGDDVRRQNYDVLRDLGARVYHFVHDVIPIDFPEFFTEEHVAIYKESLSKALLPADGFITNSAYTSAALKIAAIKHYDINIDALPTCEIPITKTTLPSEFSIKEVRKEFQTLTEMDDLYLVVGTIEPRKNHHYILDAFDLLWNEGINTTLILVGKTGWHNSDIIDRIEQHKMYGKTLFWFNDVTDNELVFLYKNVQAIIMASIVEGFGLPIIEAQRFGCKTLLSEIPVFREVGGNSLFFDLNAPQSLGQLIKGKEINLLDNVNIKHSDEEQSIAFCITKFISQ
jgi:glycosyltransferase involved in cell wall biosynthesis